MTPAPPPAITLRPAEPTLEEGAAYARYLDVAAEGFFKVMLGRSRDRIVATAYLEPDHDLSFEHVTFAERNGVIVGMASGYSGSEHARSSDEPLRRAAGRARGLRMSAVAMLGHQVLSFIETVPEGDFYLQAVAVDEDLRGLGVGSVLLERAEEVAVSKGCQRFALDVAAKNDRARRLYESRGMNIEAQSPSMPFMSGNQAQRMVKSL